MRLSAYKPGRCSVQDIAQRLIPLLRGDQQGRRGTKALLCACQRNNFGGEIARGCGITGRRARGCIWWGICRVDGSDRGDIPRMLCQGTLRGKKWCYWQKCNTAHMSYYKPNCRFRKAAEITIS